jgi:hypothetical protein
LVAVDRLDFISTDIGKREPLKESNALQLSTQLRYSYPDFLAKIIACEDYCLRGRAKHLDSQIVVFPLTYRPIADARSSLPLR